MGRGICMEGLKRFFIKPDVKAVVNAILAAIIGILCNYTVGSGIWWRWVIFIGVSIIDVIILYLYAKVDKNSDQKIVELESKLAKINGENADLEFTNEAFSSAMQGITTICKFSAKNANIQIHEIIDKARIDCKAWNFDLASETVCAALYDNVIQKLNIPKANDGIVDIEISYVKLVDEPSDTQKEAGEKRISLCGYHHPTRSGPKIRGQIRPVEADGYHDASLFLSASDQPDIQLDKEALGNVFKNGDKNDYTQYLGIPVFCLAQDRTTKMVGLLQIICHGASILAEREEDIKSIANTFFTPYAYMFLLLYKMDKALRAQPKAGGD